MKRRTLLHRAAGVSAVLAMPLMARAAGAQPRPENTQTGDAAPAAAWAEGEVRRVDRAARKLTLRHGPIPSLDMPPMTMVFQLADEGLLDGLTPGQKIRFIAEQRQGAYVVTRVAPAGP